MPITAGVASAKISELKSKVSIYQVLRDMISANYMPADGGAVELRLARSDGTSVSPAHFSVVMDELEERTAEVVQELEEWESMTFDAAKKEATVRPISSKQAAEPKRLSERKSLHGRRVDPASKQP